MAYILSKTFIQSQLAQVGIAPGQLDLASLADKIAALDAVAKASLAAGTQVGVPVQLDALTQSAAVNRLHLILLGQQVQSYTKAGYPPAA